MREAELLDEGREELARLREHGEDCLVSDGRTHLLLELRWEAEECDWGLDRGRGDVGVDSRWSSPVIQVELWLTL